MEEHSPRDVCRSWKPDLAGITEVFHARFTEHTYPLHCHDAWTVLLVDTGAVRYGLDRHDRNADQRRVTVLPPHVAHDGRSAQAGQGFQKRVLYIDTDTISEQLVGAAVDQSTLDDPALRRTISRLHETFARQPEDLEQATLLALITEAINDALSGRTTRTRPSSDAAEALRAVLDDDLSQRHNLDEIAAELGWNTTHIIRSFTEQFGLPPHRYLLSRRIDEARRRLLEGTPPAAVAIDVGFHDQAHLGRHFKNHVGTTPGRFRSRAKTEATTGWTINTMTMTAIRQQSGPARSSTT